MKNEIKELKELIQLQLNNCCPDRLPRLKDFIKSETGKSHAAQSIFDMCANDGISVQSAMSQMDSEL